MTPDDVLAIGKHAIEIALMLSAPMLLTALVVGVLISLVQAVTQIQEQTLTFVPKFLAIVAVFILILPWALGVLTRYATELYTSWYRFVP